MLFEQLQKELQIRYENDNMRSLKPAHFHFNNIFIDNKAYLNLSSNDYLSINSRCDLKDEFIEKYKDNKNFYFSSSSSRLLTGHFEIYEEFEHEIGSLFNKKALYLNSGFDANVGAISTLFNDKCLLLADKLVHASMIDGFMQSKAKFARFLHNDIESLHKEILKNKDKYESIIILVESVYSMDGDIAPLLDIVKLKKQYKNVYLYVDEAHSFGIYGNNLGLCHELNILDDVDFLLITLGKAFASCGAVFFSNKIVIDYLINHQRSFIFTTALAPVNVLFSHFILQKLKMGEFKDSAKRLLSISKYIRDTIKDTGQDVISLSQIIPFMTYTNERATAAYNFFLNKGIYAKPIKYPTVLKDKSRLRLSLCASLKDSEVELIANTIKEFK